MGGEDILLLCLTSMCTLVRCKADDVMHRPANGLAAHCPSRNDDFASDIQAQETPPRNRSHGSRPISASPASVRFVQASLVFHVMYQRCASLQLHTRIQCQLVGNLHAPPANQPPHIQPRNQQTLHTRTPPSPLNNGRAGRCDIMLHGRCRLCARPLPPPSLHSCAGPLTTFLVSPCAPPQPRRATPYVPYLHRIASQRSAPEQRSRRVEAVAAAGCARPLPSPCSSPSSSCARVSCRS